MESCSTDSTKYQLIRVDSSYSSSSSVTVSASYSSNVIYYSTYLVPVSKKIIAEIDLSKLAGYWLFKMFFDHRLRPTDRVWVVEDKHVVRYVSDYCPGTSATSVTTLASTQEVFVIPPVPPISIRRYVEINGMEVANLERDYSGIFDYIMEKRYLEIELCQTS